MVNNIVTIKIDLPIENFFLACNISLSETSSPNRVWIVLYPILFFKKSPINCCANDSVPFWEFKDSSSFNIIF